MKEITLKLPQFLFDGNFWVGVGITAGLVFALVFAFSRGMAKGFDEFVRNITNR